MDKFNATIQQKKEVISLYEQIKNKSSKLNRARPQSVSGMYIYIFYYFFYKILIKNMKKLA